MRSLRVVLRWRAMKKACDAASIVRADRIRRRSKMAARINRGRVNGEETSTWSALVARVVVEKRALETNRQISGRSALRTSRGKMQIAGRRAANAASRDNASAGIATQWPMGNTSLQSGLSTPNGKDVTGILPCFAAKSRKIRMKFRRKGTKGPFATRRCVCRFPLQDLGKPDLLGSRGFFSTPRFRPMGLILFPREAVEAGSSCLTSANCDR